MTVCLDAEGHPELLVADSYNHRVVAFRLDGSGSGARVVCGTGSKGTGATELYVPVGLAVTTSGALWVCVLVTVYRILTIS
jgi:hypothetical protein